VAYVVPTLLAPAVGVIVDVSGAGKVYIVTLCACLVVTLPLFYWWANTPASGAYAALYVGELIVGLVQALTSCVYLWTVELFPVRVRTTGVSLAYNLGIGVFGGLGPVISAASEHVISPRGPISGPALFTSVCTAMSLFVVMLSRFLAGRGRIQLTHLRSAPY